MAREYTPAELGIVYPAEKEYTPAELGMKPTAQKEYTPKELGLVPEQQPVETKTSNPFKGLVARGAQLVGEGVEGVARAAESIGDKLETAMPLTNLTPEQVEKENQLQPLFDLSKNVKDWGKDIGYAPSVQLKELTSNPLKAVPFIAERIISSSPDMVAAMGVAPAYIVSRTNEILNDRLGNDEKKWQEATVGDISAAAGAAVLETFLERFATKHLLPGAGPVAGTVGKRIGKETAIQSGTEAVEEGIGYLGGAAGTKKGVDPEQMALQMIEGAIVGGGLGAGVQSGKEYVGARARAREERAAEVPAERNAFSEATNYENTGNVAGSSEPGVSVSGEQGAAERGIKGTTTGSVGGAELSTGRTAVREEELDNQLVELDKKITDARAYIRDISEVDPSDERVGQATEYLSQLETEARALKQARTEIQTETTTPQAEEMPTIQVVGARKPTPPEQAGFDFNAEPTPQEEVTVPAKEAEFGLDAGEKLADMAAPEPIEEQETARMGLVGDATNPMGSISAFFNSIKPATENETQLGQYTSKVKNLVNDIAEFLGGKSTEEVSRYKEEGAPEPTPPKGADVSVPLEPGPELDKRMAVINNFLDSLSLAPKEKEEATTTLVKQLPGMDVNAQTQAFQSLLRIPDINTVRGIDKLRAKFDEAVARYDRARTGQDEAALPYSSRDTMRSTDPLVERRINEVLKGLEGTAKEQRTPEEKAAITYFNAWPYITAMRAAAFDLAVPFSKDFAGAAYKGQTNQSAKLFQAWVEENLPAQEYRRFEATINEYKKDIARADQAIDNMKKRKDAGPIGTIYEKMLGRAPSGKVPGVFDAGIDRSPSEVKKLDPKDFYPMHPGVVEKIEQGDLKGALTLMARDPGNQASNKVKFQAKLAQRLLDLNLKTELLVDSQEDLAVRLIKESNAQRRMVLQHFQSYDWGNDFLSKYGLDKAPTNEQTIRDQFRALQDIALNKPGLTLEQFEPIVGQFNKLMDSYKNAVVTLNSAGVYIDAWNTISLNSKANGFSNGVFLHEVAHAATYYSLDKNNYNSLNADQKKAVDELTSLYAHAAEQFDKHVVKGLEEEKYVVVNGQKFLYDEISYGFTDIQEFVAEAYSNWIFQDYLKTMKYRGTDTGIWNKFVQSIIKLFKLDNVLGYTLANADAIMRPTPFFEGQSAYAAVAPSKIRNILNNTNPANSGFMSGLQKQFDGKPEWNMAKGAMAEFLENVNDTTRKYYLGAFTLRQLNDMIGHRIPQIGKLIGGVEKMLDFRNQKLEKIRVTIKPWMELQSKDPKQAEAMHEVMIDATLVEQDPDLGPTKDKKLNAKWAALNDDAKKVYREVRQYYKEEYDSYVQMVIDNKKASLLGAGYTEAEIAAHNKINKLTITGIKELRNKLTAQGLAENDIRTSIAAGIKEALIKKGFTDREIDLHNELFAIEDQFERNRLEPYFPIRRFGNYSVQFYTGKKKQFYMFESAWARRKFIKEFTKKNQVPSNEIYMGNVVKNKIESTDLEGFQFLKELKEIVHGTKGADTKELRDNLDDAIEQLYYLTLPDKSARKMFIHRTGVPGMSKDMVRAFASSAFHMAYQHSRFKFSRELVGYLDAAKEFAKKPGDEGKVDKDYVNEIEKRYGMIMNPPDTGWLVGKLSGASFIWYMTSPASAITNLLGIPAVGYPVLAARFGAVNTAKVLGEYGTKFVRSGVRDADGELSFFSLSNNEKDLSKLELEAYNRFVIDGLLDITLPHDLAGLAEGTASVYKNAGQTVMSWISTPFHVTERANREIVAMSAYKLAFDKFKSKGYTEKVAQEKAIESAKDLTYKSMFDYSTLNKPRYFQHPAAKVILQFKQFSQHMTYLLARSAYEYIGKQYTPDELADIRYQIKEDHRTNKSHLPPLTDAELNKATTQFVKDLKTEARDRLAGTLGMTAIFAGITGLPLWSLVSSIMNIMHTTFGDDDDDWDFDNWFKNWCNTTFGGFYGDAISRGVVSQVLGANVADRLSLNDLWFRDARKSPDEVTAFQNTVFNLMGPTAGLAMNAMDAIKQYRDGHIQRAIETASPAFIKNFLKGARFMDEGRATTLRGNELVGDITTKEALTQMVGFAPERLAQRQKANIQMMTANAEILDRRQSLLDAHFMAWDNHDSDMRSRVLEKVREFNRKYPEKAITIENLQNSAKTRMKQRRLANNLGGANIDPKLVRRLRSMGDYGDTSE
jgi:hypothetical protein